MYSTHVHNTHTFDMDICTVLYLELMGGWVCMSLLACGFIHVKFYLLVLAWA